MTGFDVMFYNFLIKWKAWLFLNLLQMVGVVIIKSTSYGGRGYYQI